jgi:hypothetical protein
MVSLFPLLYAHSTYFAGAQAGRTSLGVTRTRDVEKVVEFQKTLGQS